MSALERELSKLTLVVVPSLSGRRRPEVPGFVDGRLEVLFNPTEYSIDRETNYAEVAIPGLDSPVLQTSGATGTSCPSSCSSTSPTACKTAE